MSLKTLRHIHECEMAGTCQYVDFVQFGSSLSNVECGKREDIGGYRLICLHRNSAGYELFCLQYLDASGRVCTACNVLISHTSLSSYMAADQKIATIHQYHKY